MTGIVVFAGPTLADADRAQAAAIDVRGPAACGDVARAAADGATVIGLIDGLFETTLSTWHKELLWAMSSGARLFGAASMGALRAAEMAPFGMTGVGEIFAAYQDGRLTDDDEVAVLHGPEELGYRAITEAMVNVRWTLEAAVAADVIGAADAAAVARAAKSIFYKERTWELVWRKARQAGVPCEAAASWVGYTGGVNVKRHDAQALVRLLADRPDAPAPATPTFPRTVYWERMRARLGIAAS